jgi:hypothetical protein
MIGSCAAAGAAAAGAVIRVTIARLRTVRCERIDGSGSFEKLENVEYGPSARWVGGSQGTSTGGLREVLQLSGFDGTDSVEIRCLQLA